MEQKSTLAVLKIQLTILGFPASPYIQLSSYPVIQLVIDMFLALLITTNCMVEALSYQ